MKAEIGDIFQIDPNHDPIFGGKLLIVTEPKNWGVQGYVDTFEGHAYYRCSYENMELVGKVRWKWERDEEPSEV